MTIGDLLVRSANKFPQKTAVVEGVSMNFSQFNERVNRLSCALCDLGLEKGDRLGVLVHNSHQFMEIYFAAAKTGGIFCPYNNHLKEFEIQDLLNYSAPKFLFLDQDFEEMIRGLSSGLSSVEKYICLQECETDFFDYYESLVDRGSNEEPNCKIYDDDLLSIFFYCRDNRKAEGSHADASPPHVRCRGVSN